MIKQLPTQELLQEMFFYDGGILYRKKNCSKGRANAPIGWVEKSGYWATSVCGTTFRLHRLVWQFHNGNCPPLLDHIDGNKNNNAIENLRLATVTQNNANRKVSKFNKLGLKGVCFERGKYKANIKINGRTHHLGYFNNSEDAYGVYCKKAKEIYGEFAWTNNNANI
ncbi:putative NHN endonuclease [uncultured Caudovirales phage]|uniref:Putative NHN endonuclease n=1 Tax=uncultured Caudovirales phage TaxID=2100421 RepID=A0A6J5PVN1_9CAUD|nr:putative NHN endonuclease [uncultured Caudovirales phage]CAB4173265.1 putative NHN endonuclease [uncultured Caudovirales phage]CAB4184906.1 putative NHN endonuclease [uncultured Caudovirales phage]CAB4204314.1 putative NHN endonuclease [uncultured Caudovirales phage]CAB5238476.1 putative NHN endonuclease [uncultured Caudovirales phage]